MTRWLMPILSFTAEELWKEIPGKHGGTVFTAEWYTLPQAVGSGALAEIDWQQIIAVKEAVNKALEAVRANGGIGSSLQADVVLYCSGSLQKLLQTLGDELRFVLLSSSALIKPLADEGEATEVEGLRITVATSQYTNACAAGITVKMLERTTMIQSCAGAVLRMLMVLASSATSLEV